MAAGAVAGGEHHRRHLAVAGVAAGADAERSLAAFAKPGTQPPAAGGGGEPGGGRAVAAGV